jgi:acetyl-CoA synthetase
VKNIFYPIKEKFDNPLIGSMEEYKKLVDKFDKNYEKTWAEFADDKLDWFKKYDKILDESNPPFYKWFTGGKLNVAHECVDRHLKTKADKRAIIFEGDNGDSRYITYKELSKEVNKTANMFRDSFGVNKGDRVVIYMPMIPEAAICMLACAKLGAIHSVVFGGFSAEALRDRVIDASAKLVVTADGAYRKGKPYMLKPVVDKALEQFCECVESVCVVRRNNQDITLVENRDKLYDELIKNQSEEFEAVEVDSEDPLFLLYTSGSTGKPKGVQHSSAGYILWAKMTMQWVFDIKDSDVYWCTADIGWITGHTYIIYGPLSAGATTVMFEGVPTFPDAGRCWKMIEKYKINQFYTAPTAIRLLHKQGENEPDKYDLSSLRILGTVGEPIDAKAWEWYYNKIGGGKCSVVDTWWQTETGGHMISPLPAATPVKPSCATFPLPGIKVDVLNANGESVGVGEKGLLCIVEPWPSMIRTIWNDDKRFVKSYFEDCKKNNKSVYFSGDGAIIDEDGYITITGRTDDVINVSGHRLGTAEVESAVKKYDEVAEVAVVGKPHEIKGEGILAYIVLKNENINNYDDIKVNINRVIKSEIGAIALCDTIVFVPGLPKTRSGKIMRRILRSIATKSKITQDISTLEDPSIVKQIEKIFENTLG